MISNKKNDDSTISIIRSILLNIRDTFRSTRLHRLVDYPILICYIQFGFVFQSIADSTTFALYQFADSVILYIALNIKMFHFISVFFSDSAFSNDSLYSSFIFCSHNLLLYLPSEILVFLSINQFSYNNLTVRYYAIGR